TRLPQGPTMAHALAPWLSVDRAMAERADDRAEDQRAALETLRRLATEGVREAPGRVGRTPQSGVRLTRSRGVSVGLASRERGSTHPVLENFKGVFSLFLGMLGTVFRQQDR